MRELAGLGLLSAAVLFSQVALTRVFSIAQFYHFAFLVISLALLGFGASGSILAIWPRLRGRGWWPWYALGFAVSSVLGYAVVNAAPFDSYSVAWDSGQLALLVANLLALAVPFGFAGALVGAMLDARSEEAGRTYGANLLGSAAGAVLAAPAIGWLGSERALLAGAVLGSAAAVILAGPRAPAGAARRALAASLLGTLVALALLVLLPVQLELRLSPYKRLSQIRLDPAATIVETRQDAEARLDVVRSPTIHSAPGLSLAFLGALPEQAGLVVDGETLLAVPRAGPDAAATARALPVAVAYAVRPEARVLLLGSGGGMDALAALEAGAREVTIVEPERLVYEALAGELGAWSGLTADPRIRLEQEQIRTYAQRGASGFDVVELTLADNYRPISSGAFTLTEDPTLTVEAFAAYLELARPNGILVLTRWLQSPPSESLRTLGLIAEALDGRPPLEHVVAFRSFQTVTFMVKPAPFTDAETDRLLAAIDRFRYDLVLAPTMPPEMINRYARVDDPLDHELALELATTPDRDAFFRGYAFDVTPPTDDRPFFFHFFRWEQTPAVLETLGRRWQPFGGSGYLVLVGLLVFALLAAAALVVAPVGLRGALRRSLRQAGTSGALRTLGYFAALGLGFLFVEVALIGRLILVLGHPTLAFAVVSGALLLFSGLGSWVSARLPWRAAMAALALLLALAPWAIATLAPSLLALPLAPRIVVVALLLAPPGFLMGVPFARGIAALGEGGSAGSLVPWAWAANGAASVVSAIAAAMLALSLGFGAVLLAAAGLYLVAALIRPRASAARRRPP